MFYPSPKDPNSAQKRDVFENIVPLYVSRDVPITKKAKTYDDASLQAAGIHPDYSFNNFNGYLNIPIGSKEFMSQDNINGVKVFNSYAQYKNDGSN